MVVLDMSLAVLSVVANLVVITSIRFDSIWLDSIKIITLGFQKDKIAGGHRST